VSRTSRQGTPQQHRSWPIRQAAPPRRHTAPAQRGPRLCRSGENELADLLTASQNAAAGAQIIVYILALDSNLQASLFCASVGPRRLSSVKDMSS